MLFLALAAVVAAFYLTREKSFDWRLFAHSVTTLDAGWMGSSLIFSFATYLVRALRWRVLIRPQREKTPLGPMLSATVIGFSAGTMIGRAGEMVRPYLIAARTGLPFPSQVAAWIVERMYDILVALAVFGGALIEVRGAMGGGPSVSTALGWTMRVGGIAIFGGSALALSVLLAMKYRSLPLQAWLLRTLSFLSEHHFTRVEKLISGFVAGAQATRSQSATVILLGYTIVEWLLVAACYACVLRAFGANGFTAADVLVLTGFVAFGSLVQLPAVGGGFQVTAVLVLTEIFSLPVELSTSMGLMLWIVSFLAIVPVGFVLALREGLTWARLREAEMGGEA